MMVLLSSILLARLTHAWVIIADGKCQIVISTTSDNVLTTKWSFIWQTTESIVAKCVRAGKGGKAKISVPPRSSSIRHFESIILIFHF